MLLILECVRARQLFMACAGLSCDRRANRGEVHLFQVLRSELQCSILAYSWMPEFRVQRQHGPAFRKPGLSKGNAPRLSLSDSLCLSWSCPVTPVMSHEASPGPVLRREKCSLHLPKLRGLYW